MHETYEVVRPETVPGDGDVGTVLADDRVLLAALLVVWEVLEREGEDAVAWFNEDMDARELVRHLCADRSKRVERLSRLACTLRCV